MSRTPFCRPVNTLYVVIFTLPNGPDSEGLSL